MKKAPTIKEIKALSSMDVAWLNKELKKAQEELFVLKMKHAANELKEVNLLKAARKQIARIKTYLTALN